MHKADEIAIRNGTIKSLADGQIIL